MPSWAVPALVILIAIWVVARWRRSWQVCRIAQVGLTVTLLLLIAGHVRWAAEQPADATVRADRANALALRQAFGVKVDPSRIGCLQDLASRTVLECVVVTGEGRRFVEYRWTTDGDKVNLSLDGRRLSPR